MNRALILLLLVALPCSPQTSREDKSRQTLEDNTKWPIQSLAVEGNENYTDQQIMAVAGLKLGQQANRATFEDAQVRLQEAGAFESVAFQYAPAPGGKGYAAVIEVVEIQQIYPIRFEYINSTDEQLRAWLKQKDPLFTEKVPGSDDLLRRYSAAIEEYLKLQGNDEKIVGELTADRPEELFIMFHPAGVMPVVAEVDFTGNSVIPTGTLRQAIHGVAIGARYTESRFHQLLDTSVRPLYEARGRLRVAFSKLSPEQAQGDVNGLKITVEVNEGETYELGRVRVEGTASMNKILLQIADLKIGDLANFDVVKAALDRISDRMRKDGYMRVRCRADRDIDDSSRNVDLVLRVEPGTQFRFGELIIEGLDVHGEHEIRRIWGMDEGAAFDAEFPEFFLQRVRDDGVFDNLRETSSSIKINEEDLTVDVTLVFNPKPREKFPSTFDDPLSKPPKR